MRIDPDIPRDTALHYVERINRAIDYIVQHLEEPLQLPIIARAAAISPFHFHRIFRLILGETLHQFVKRLRLERALWMLSHQRQRSLTAVAVACGFESLSDFSRSFKQRYGVAPSSFNLKAHREQKRKELEATALVTNGGHRLAHLPANDNRDSFEVRLRPLPARCVAYIRVADSFRPGAVAGAAERLVAWAEQRNMADGQWLGYMWDDPEIVALKDCRYDIAVEVPDVVPEGEVGRFEFPAMTVAEIEIRGGVELEMRAMEWLFGVWLPKSGYVPMDQPFFEAMIGRPFQHGDEYFELYIQIPVERG